MDKYNIYTALIVIKNRKFVIIATTILLMGLCAIFISMNSNKHIVVATITPGRDVRGGQVFYFEAPHIIASAIDAGTFASQVKSKLNLPNDISLNVSAKVPFKTKLISIQYKTKDIKLGKKILNATIDSLIASYNDNYGLQIKATTKRIEEKQNRIKALDRKKEEWKKKTAIKIEQKKAEIANIHEQIKLLDNHLTKTLSTRNQTHKNTQQLLEQRTNLLSKNDKNSGLDRLLYTSVIQGNISYQSSLDEDIINIRRDKKKLEGRINSLKISIDTDKINLEEALTSIENERADNLVAVGTLKLEQDALVPIQIVQQPTDIPAKLPASPLILLFLSLIAGITVGSTFAFFLEILNSQCQEEAKRT